MCIRRQLRSEQEALLLDSYKMCKCSSQCAKAHTHLCLKRVGKGIFLLLNYFQTPIS